MWFAMHRYTQHDKGVFGFSGCFYIVSRSDKVVVGNIRGG